MNPFRLKARDILYLIAISFSITIQISSRFIEDDKVFQINKSSKPLEFKGNFLNEGVSNEFKVKISSKDLLQDQYLYIILESDNNDFYLNIWQDSNRDAKSSSLKVGTYSGNCLFVLGSGLFNKKLSYLNKHKSFYFGVRAVKKQTDQKQTNFRLRLLNGKKLELPLGNIYTTMLDSSINFLNIDFTYDGTLNPDLNKLRFQLTAIRTKPGWQMSSTLNYGSLTFLMNPIFKKSLGGVLSQPKLPVCHERNCKYSLSLKILNVHMLNLETFMIDKMEKLSIQHYEDYYDKTYEENQLIIYELPYSSEMDNLDISISLIPVTGHTELYVNPNTVPPKLASYAYSEKGHLAKRITIEWDQLVQMKAEKTSLYIAVQVPKPGEFLIKIDAHDHGFRGTMAPGVIEAGMVQFQEIANYMYLFEVIQTQEITFDIKLNVNSGDGDLFLLQCNDYEDCGITKELVDSSTSPILKVRNNLNEKDIKHTFTCQHDGKSSATVCQFVIGVLGKENHGTHYELSLRESNFHRLVIPGHSISLNIEPKEETFVKLSLPHSTTPKSKLYLSIESLWGEFDMYLAKEEEYPSKELNDISESFTSTMKGSLNSLKIIELDPKKLSDHRIEGTYYVSIKAKKESSLNLKFYEKSEHEISIHTLTAGKQVRGNITHSSDIIFYSIRISLDDIKASSVVVNLTPTKGTFIMFANRNGVLPGLYHHEFFSENNHLELKVSEGKQQTEDFLIGIAIHNPNKKKESFEGNFQFLISFSYSNKPIQLNPGILASHIVQPSNVFLIKILNNFENLLILKSIIDGYNIKLCGKFTTTETVVSKDLQTEDCAYSAHEKSVSLYIKKEQLQKECSKVLKKSKNTKPSCYLKISVSGFVNQSFRLGYTYNNKPFQLVKGQIINGPWMTDPSAQINFIYHPDSKSELGIYFNSKGSSLNLYSKLVDSENFDESMTNEYPNAENNDDDKVRRIGYVENVYYRKSEVAAISGTPELFLSVRPGANISGENSDTVFDSKNSFILQTAMDCIEIMRTQTISQQIQEGEWNYYSFYNNGNTNTLKVYVISEVATPIQTMISLGLTSRPPITNKPLITKTGIGSIEIDVKIEDLKQSSQDNRKDLRGYYIIAVKSSADTNVNLYWNNKEDLDYIELTPNEPSTMLLGTDKKFYFGFYARDSEGKITGDSAKIDRKDIRVYLKVNVMANVYVLKSLTGDLDAPGPDNYIWKTNTAEKGGIAMVQIDSSDTNYCVDCLYIGYVEVKTAGQLSILANIKHDNIPMHLKPGFTFPESLNSHENSVFRLINPDVSIMDLTISILSGFVNIYVGRTKDVSTTKYDELYSMETELNIHKFIQLSPFKYNINGPSEWFVLIDNPKLDQAVFTITVDKNKIKSPIEPGITKFVRIGPGENTDFYYKPSKSESIFELRLELTQVMDSKFIDQTLGLLDQFISLYEIGVSGEHLPLKSNETHVNGNKLYIKFQIPLGSDTTFGIRVYNPVASGVALRVDLLNGMYKLVNFNTYNLGMVKNKKSMIYEAYGAKGKYIFVDVRKCYGSPKVSFYQTDYQNIEKNQSMKYKVIRDANSFIQYVKLEHEKIFIKVENLKGNFTSYTLNAFSERDMDLNPYSEITQEGDGKVDVETDSHTVRVKPLKLQSSIGKEFTNKIKYSVFLSTSLKVMRYAKNCGKNMIHKAFKKPDIKEFSVSLEASHEDIKKNAKKKASKFDQILKLGHINIKFDGLDNNKKYYGIVVAQVDLYPVGEGFLTPVRSGKAYYDEFTIITPRLAIPIQLIISSLIILGMLMAVFCIVKSYIFGNINKIYDMREKIPESLKEFDDESSFGFKAFTLLEKAYFDEKSKMEEAETAASQVEDQSQDEETESQESAPEILIEEEPQEIELKEIEDMSQPLDA